MHPDIVRFSEILRSLVTLLQNNGADFWALQVQHCLSIVEKDDAWGAQRFFGLLGGMGSLNDLQFPSPKETDELRVILGKACSLKQSLLKLPD